MWFIIDFINLFMIRKTEKRYKQAGKIKSKLINIKVKLFVTRTILLNTNRTIWTQKQAFMMAFCKHFVESLNVNNSFYLQLLTVIKQYTNYFITVYYTINIKINIFTRN